MCPHTTRCIYVSAYYYICVGILLYMCLHTRLWYADTHAFVDAWAYGRMHRQLVSGCRMRSVYNAARERDMLEHRRDVWLRRHILLCVQGARARTCQLQDLGGVVRGDGDC
jgi:hypothetical protein